MLDIDESFDGEVYLVPFFSGSPTVAPSISAGDIEEPPSHVMEDDPTSSPSVSFAPSVMPS